MSEFTSVQLAPATEPDAQTATAAVEPFSVRARRAADALADLIEPDDCPDAFVRTVAEFMADLSNEYCDVALDVRTRFAALAMVAAKEEREAA